MQNSREGKYEMRKIPTSLFFLLLSALTAVPVVAQGPPAAASASAPGELQKKVEAYLRNLYAWGTEYKVTIGAPAESEVPGFYKVTVDVALGDQAETGIAYISKDGRHFIQGEILDLGRSPFDDNRAKMKLEGAPSRGPANAPVVVVDYSDFQCPTCKRYHETVRQIAPKYPNVRFVFKNYPLGQVHPWSELAAAAGVCANKQSAAAFWTLHDLLFDNQESITAESAFQRILEFVAQAGLNAAALTPCIAAEDTKAAVAADLAEGRALRVANTPTVFVNGRRIVGGEPGLLVQFIDFELAKSGATPASPPRPQPGTSAPATPGTPPAQLGKSTPPPPPKRP